jgi:DNA-binding beta-propeller fold protein YncE
VRLAAFAFAVLACVLAAAAPAGASYRLTDSWGRLGKGAGEFGGGVLGGGANRQYDDPAGIAVASNGTVLVVDTSNNRVQRYTAAGRYLGSFGRRGLDKGFVQIRLTDRFFQPEGIAVGPGGTIFVADAGNDRVMKYGPTGRFRARLGKHGSYAGQYVQPWGIAVGHGSAYVADQGNYRIQRWSTGGRRRGAFGHFGRGRGDLVTPYGVAVSPSGDRVYVSDLIRHKVIAFSPTGRVLDEWGGPGAGAGQFLKPAGVAVSRDGSVFVADRCNDRVQRFTAGGRYIESFGVGTLRGPTFVALNRGGDVFVSDQQRVYRFGAASGSAGTRALSGYDDDPLDIWCRHVADQAGVDVSSHVDIPDVDLPDVDVPSVDLPSSNDDDDFPGDFFGDDPDE